MHSLDSNKNVAGIHLKAVNFRPEVPDLRSEGIWHTLLSGYQVLVMEVHA